MPYHDAAKAAFYDVAEGKKLYRVEPLAAEIEGGQRLVGVDLRVAMPGEVLGHGEHSAPLQPLSVSSRLPGYPPGVFPERACADNRVAGVDVDIGHGGEVDLYTQFA